MICARTRVLSRLLLSMAVLLCVPVLDATIDRGASARSSSRVRRAKTLFSRAEIKYRLGEFATALSLYKKALSLARRPSLVFNIAQCHRFLERPKKALFYYELYLSEWKRSRPGTDPPNLAEVQGFITALRQQLATPKLLIEGRPEGAEVLVDGRLVGKLPMETAVEISSGDHQLRIKARGYRTYRRLISLRPGQQLTRRIKLRRRRSRKRSGAWLATGIATSALAVGAEIAALVLTKKTNDQYDDTSEFTQYKTGAIISHVTAGAMAATAVVSFVLYARSGRSSSEHRGANLSKPRVVLSPGHDGAMITAIGTF